MRKLRTYPLLVIIFMTIFALQSNGQDHKTEDFNKALKRAIKSPEKKKNKEALEAAYIELQSSYIPKLIATLTISDKLAQDAKTDLLEYLNTKKAYSALYKENPLLDNEDKLSLLLDQLIHDYYDRGNELIQNDQTKDYAKAKEYLGLVQAINPNYQNVNELFNRASEQSKYNILITYDLGNFPEFQPLMQQLLNEINLKIENYNTEKKTLHLSEKPDQDYQLIYKFSFDYLDLGMITQRSTHQDFQQTVNGQIKRARITYDNFRRDIKATGNFSIFSNIKNEVIEKDPFNLNFTTNLRHATLSGDREALNPYRLRDILLLRGSEVDVELQSEAEFKRRMFQLLERHLRYDYSSSDLK